MHFRAKLENALLTEGSCLSVAMTPPSRMTATPPHLNEEEGSEQGELP